LRQSVGNETAEALVGRHPIDPGSRLQKISDLAAGEALFRAVVYKPVTIRARKPFAGAEPQEAFGVLDDAVDVIAGKPSAVV
jgi:hypothetical protein